MLVFGMNQDESGRRFLTPQKEPICLKVRSKTLNLTLNLLQPKKALVALHFYVVNDCFLLVPNRSIWQQQETRT